LRAFDNADNLSYLEQRFALLLWSRFRGRGIIRESALLD